jgi:hypothetical protein
LPGSRRFKEAGVGRDSYYRTPQAVVRFTAARAPAGTSGTELARLRDQVTALTRAAKDSKRDHAAQASELEDQVKIYAGQVQVLPDLDRNVGRDEYAGGQRAPHAFPLQRCAVLSVTGVEARTHS